MPQRPTQWLAFAPADDSFYRLRFILAIMLDNVIDLIK